MSELVGLLDRWWRRILNIGPEAEEIRVLTEQFRITLLACFSRAEELGTAVG